eukprot:gnl/Trimastix_PCT/1800.p1 GENE.gnl/Trimastix_PCT/1800~~gnl/Trimastix_PCT/1800.p1  ORF type:complete len:342 (+),score=78.87 gnl/Trimastix_PCT/1800:50-1075(+)
MEALEHTTQPSQIRVRKKIVTKITIPDVQSEIFCLRFSPDGQFLAAGCGDGSIRVFNSQTGRLNFHLNVGTTQFPTTCIRFRPPMANAKTRHVLLAGNCDGSVSHWHVTSSKCLHSLVEENNQVLALDYRPDGTKFATVGLDRKVRIYDEATKTHYQTLYGGHGTVTAGHSNRVFAVKFMPNDPNVMLSGGWGNTLQVWGLRVDPAVRSIYGPHICGDAIDIHENIVLTGSWRPQDSLQLWDFGTGRLMETIPWRLAGVQGDPCLLYASQFSRDPQAQFILAGGSGANQGKVFERSTGQTVGTVQMSKAVFATDFSPTGPVFAVGGAEDRILLFDVRSADQ